MRVSVAWIPREAREALPRTCERVFGEFVDESKTKSGRRVMEVGTEKEGIEMLSRNARADDGEGARWKRYAQGGLVQTDLRLFTFRRDERVARECDDAPPGNRVPVDVRDRRSWNR